MPKMANIVIKKADGTTDVTYTGVTGAAGDGTPAVWRNTSHSPNVASRPSLRVAAQSNGPKTARRVSIDYEWPIMRKDAGGNEVPNGKALFKGTYTIPESQDAAVIDEQAAQLSNLIGSALMKQMFSSGYAASGS